MPQTLQSSKYSPIGGARCTLSRVLDRTSRVHEVAPRSMVNLRVSGVSGRAEHSAWVLGRLHACLKRCSLQNTAPSGVHPAPSRGCWTPPRNRRGGTTRYGKSESLWRLGVPSIQHRSSAGSTHASNVAVLKIKPHRGSTMHPFEGV